MAGTKEWLDNLKLRASYGMLGNQSVGSYYPYISTMPSGTSTFLLDGSGILTDLADFTRIAHILIRLISTGTRCSVDLRTICEIRGENLRNLRKPVPSHSWEPAKQAELSFN